VIDADLPVDGDAALPLLDAHVRSEATAMMHSTTVPQRTTRAAVRTMMIVGKEPDDRVLETVTEGGGYDVIVVEPTTSAYSRIKGLAPSVVVLTMTIDDVEACQLLAMLKLDRDTAQIPLFTCLLEPAAAQSDI